MIAVRGISKSYGGVQALRGIDLDLMPGEVHAICGENGAGKSTLNKILAGTVVPTSGAVTVFGEPLEFGSIRASEKAGVAIVHQESTAFPDLTAIENHQLLREPTLLGGLWLDRPEMRARTTASLNSLGMNLPLDTPAHQLSLAQRQMVAIGRAVALGCRLLILDEPTASLSSRESEALFKLVRDLKAQGVAILYVSHRLEEVLALSDRVTVLRDGSLVAGRPTPEIDRDWLIRQMVGRAVEFEPRTPSPYGDVCLRVRNLTQAGTFENVSLEVRRGEVVVLAGLIGAGRSELARAISGLEKPDAGTVEVFGRLAMVPEDRQHEGLHLSLPIRENLNLAVRHGVLIDSKGERSRSSQLISDLAIKTSDDLLAVSSLSGGNQQKVLLGKWLATQPDVLILDEPTRGVDVAAKDQVHRLISDLAKSQHGILVISSDMSEVLALADRVIVMREGQIAGEVCAGEIDQVRILELSLPSHEGQHVSTPRRALPRELSVGILLALVFLAASLKNPHFFSLENLRDMMVAVAPALIVGSAMTLVILTREIDISVGSMMGFCAAVLGVATSTDRMGLPPVVGVILCLGVGLVGGLFNGFLVAKAKIPSIIVTLGMLSILRGLSERALGGKWIEHVPDALRNLGTGNLAGLPIIVWVACLAVAVGWWITRRSKLGTQIYALGSQPAAARLQGVPTDRVKLTVFALSGLACGVAALFSATQLQVIESGFGGGFELVVIAGVVVGGTYIRGGRGSILGTVLGSILLGTLSTVLIFMKMGEASTYWERAVQGILILLAVLWDHLSRRKGVQE